MQIHEITRRRIGEGAVKGIDSAPVNFSRTTVGMPQQSVAPSKVSFAPNMMPKAAPAVAPAPGTNLAVVPQTTAVAKTPGTGVATVPAGGAVTATPKPGQVAPAAWRANQYDPNVIDVDAKDITHRRALPATTGNYDVNTGAPISDKGRAAAASQAAFATSPKGKALNAKIAGWDAEDAAAAPAPAAKPWTPVNTNVKSGGSAEAQAWKAQQAAQTQPVTPAATTAPGKAGFMRNAAEYFANKTMNKAGIPLDQQVSKDKGWHPGGHMAAKLGQGTTAIAQAEQKIAYNLAQEYAKQGTLNRNKTQLTPTAIKSAANLINQAENNLQLNFDNITQLTIKYAQEIRQKQQDQKKKEAQGQIEIEQLKDQLKVAEQTKRYKQVQQLADELKRRGLTANDINQIRADAVNDIKNNFKNNLNKMTTGDQQPAAPVSAKTTPAERKQLLDLLGPEAYAALEKQGKL